MTETDLSGQAATHCLPFSLVFKGKHLCPVCGLPFSPQNFSPRGLCMKCTEEVKVAGAITVLAAKVPQRGFKDAIDAVRRMGRPLTLDIAEGAMDDLGGATLLGQRIASDLKQMRGEHLPEELKQFHDPDYKVIKGMYESIIRLATERDKLVGEVGDPLDGLSEEDLMAIASQAAMIRIEVDADFRKQLLSAIVKLDPEAVLSTAEEALDLVLSGPRVEVLKDGEPI